MLHLVKSSQGQNKPLAHLTAQRAQYESGHLNELVRLHRGVYCDEDDLEDLAGFMRRNAVRIANYLYRGVALSHASAYFKGPVEIDRAPGDKDKSPRFKLFLAGSYSHKVEMRYLDIVMTDGLKNGRIGQFCDTLIDDQDKNFGPLHVSCLGDEVVYLQQFGRRRYNLERFLSDASLSKLLSGLMERHGDALGGRLRTVADEVTDFAVELDGALDYLRKFEKARRYGLTTGPKISGGAPGSALVGLLGKKTVGTVGSLSLMDSVSLEEEGMNNVFEFSMGWYGRPIGRIVNNGVAWNFSFNDGWMLPLSVGKTRPGIMPPFVHNLFPEGYLLNAINDGIGSGFNTNVLSQSERFLSNISIVKNDERLKEIPLDILDGRLKDHVDEHAVFKGTLSSMPNTSAEFIGELNRVLIDIRMPRESGNQPKIPCFLQEDGTLVPSMDLPFTHIVKLAGLYKDPNYLRGVVEWASMSLARAGGLKTCDFSLLEMDNGSLAYMCERFDVPESPDDMRMIYAEDFCSVHSMGPTFKMLADDGLEALTGGFKKFSGPNRSDDEQMFRLIYTNYVLENGDFHLKNASLVRVASPTLDTFRSTRLSPAYDIMNTRYFSDFPLPPDARETMILDFRGKNSGFTKDDFKVIGETLGLDPERCEALMLETSEAIAKEASRLALSLHTVLDGHPKATGIVSDLLERAVMCCQQLYPQIQSLSVKSINPALAKPAAYAADASDSDPNEPDFIRQVRKALAKP